jgi:DNA-binding protein HU-beta
MSDVMNKNELVEAISKESGLTKSDAEKSLDAFRTVVTKALKKGTKISMVGFVTIEKKKRPARTGRNPQTGKPIKVAAKNVAKFKAGKALADAMN